MPQGAPRIEDTRDYVLSRVRKAHRDLLGRAERLAADAVEDIVTPTSEGAVDAVRGAMSKYNGLDLRVLEQN
jgi:peptidyl-tRNA hydrolase